MSVLTPGWSLAYRSGYPSAQPQISLPAVPDGAWRVDFASCRLWGSANYGSYYGSLQIVSGSVIGPAVVMAESAWGFQMEAPDVSIGNNDTAEITGPILCTTGEPCTIQIDFFGVSYTLIPLAEIKAQGQLV